MSSERSSTREKNHVVYMKYPTSFQMTNKLLFYLFADDTTVFVTADNDHNLYDTMNSELLHLTNWFHANLLSLNVKKTHYIIFSSSRRKVQDDPSKTIST